MLNRRVTSMSHNNGIDIKQTRDYNYETRDARPLATPTPNVQTQQPARQSSQTTRHIIAEPAGSKVRDSDDDGDANIEELKSADLKPCGVRPPLSEHCCPSAAFNAFRAGSY
jgi:hypothetical protein